MHILCWTVSSISQRTAEKQSLHKFGFLRVIYTILNASVLFARNETRGGNLPLSGTVCYSQLPPCGRLAVTDSS